MRRWLSGLLPAFFLFSCAASTDVPRRELDRAYTLPDGTKAWHAAGGVGLVERQAHSPVSYTEVGGNPLLFEHSLSENWTVESNPIPSALRYQIFRDESQRWGARLGSPLGYTSFRGFIFYPFLELDYLRRISSRWGWQATANVTHTFSTEETVLDGFGYGLRAGPVFQLDETKAISPRMGVEFSRKQRMRTYGLNYVNDPNFDGGTNAVFPLQLLFSWSFGQSWGTEFLYSFERLTHERDYKGNLFFLDIHYFWTSKTGG